MNSGNIQAGIDRLDAQLQQLHQIQQYYQQIAFCPLSVLIF